MTLLTGELLVLAGKGELGGPMIELQGRFPTAISVTTAAIRTDLAAMFIGMTMNTLCRKTQVRAVQVLDNNLGTF